MANVQIRQAVVGDLETLVLLFDAYRQFYRQPSDRAGALEFLRARFEHGQSAIFLAFVDGVAMGFMQLYPSFSSASMARIFVLNDLFVSPEGRRCGVGTALLSAAADYGQLVGAVRLSLSTEVTNRSAQELYEGAGWKRDTVFCGYQLTL